MLVRTVFLPILIFATVNVAQASNVRRLTKKTTSDKLPFEVKCSQTIERKVNTIGEIPTVYEKLPKCNGIAVDLENAKASSVFKVRGQNDMFPEIWAKCLTAGNTHDLLLFQRYIKAGQGLTDGWECVDSKQFVCEKADDSKSITAIGEPEIEYLFVTLHKELEDKVSVGVSCIDLTPSPTRNPTKSPTHAPTKSPTHKPTKSPTHKPTLPPQPAPEVKCGQTINKKVKVLGQIPAIYEKLPKCKNFAIDLKKAKASSVFRIQGKIDMFPEIWAKCTKGGNTHDLILFRRPAKIGQGLTDGWQCVDFQQIICNKADDTKAITTIAAPEAEYLFVTLHKELEDKVSVGVACTPSPPTRVSCNKKDVTKRTPTIGRIGAPFNKLGTCGKSNVDITKQDYSSAFQVDGDPHGGKTWIVITCRRVNESVHYLFSYARKKGSTSFGCQRVVEITCDRVGKTTRIDQPIKQGFEYVFLAAGSGNNLLEDVVVTSKCNKPPTLPPVQKCNTTVRDNTKDIGKLPAFYNALGQCGKTKVDLAASTTSKAYRAFGGPTGGQAWVVLPCSRVDQTNNHVMIYSRPSNQKFKGILDGFSCDNVRFIKCSRRGIKVQVDQHLRANREYLFIVAAQGRTQGQPISITARCNPLCQPKKKIDFEGLSAGTIVSKLPGVTVNGKEASRRGNAAMIFDSRKPTGGDTDLSFTNRGNILILSEDGNRENPDDSDKGGTFFFHFDSPVTVDSFILLDGEANESGSVFLLDSLNRPLFNRKISGSGNNSQETIDLRSTPNVKSMIIRFAGSGAIDDIRYTIPCEN